YAGSIALNGEQLRLKAGKDDNLIAADAKQLQAFRARIAMVFQHFNLWAHMTVLENVIEAPMHVLKLSRDEAIAKAELYLQKVGVYHRKDFHPSHLSGGEQQ